MIHEVRLGKVKRPSVASMLWFLYHILSNTDKVAYHSANLRCFNFLNHVFASQWVVPYQNI